MKNIGKIKLHIDADCQGMTGENNKTKGYGIRGTKLLWRNTERNGNYAIHLIELGSYPHRYKAHPKYSFETLPIDYDTEDIYSIIVILSEQSYGILKPE